MSTLRLFLFGPPRLERGGVRLDLTLRKALGLLVYVAETDQMHSRDTLATMLWPEHEQAGARGRLRRTLYALNQVVGDDVLWADAEAIGKGPAVTIWRDTEAFRDHLAVCLSDERATDNLEDGRRERLGAAVNLYSDDFLAGFTLKECPQFDEWQFFQRETYRRLLGRALTQLADMLGNEGAWEQAISFARRRLALDPLHEPAQRQLMRFFAYAGQPAAAVRHYEASVQRLEEELGVAPEPETVDLYEAIKARRVATQPRAIERIEAVPMAHNLPPQSTSFVGRKAELADLERYVNDPAVRLISIVGAGGMGKTRLALAAATRWAREEEAQKAERFGDGLYFVPLASLEETTQIVPAIIEALAAPLETELAARQQLLRYLHHRKMLLIMDNFEHLLEGATLVATLLEAAPQLRVMVTSRERLWLQREHLLVVEGLPYPPQAEDGDAVPRRAGSYPAVQLFVQRARHVQRDFRLEEGNAEIIAAICRLVGGMPLAVEMAASWCDSLALDAIAAGIEESLDFLSLNWRDVPARQRSVRAMFDSTWQRLDKSTQKTFTRLTVFRGGFSRAAALQVANAGTSDVISVHSLMRLVNKNLLQYDRVRDRYDMHRLLRQYGEEKLVQTPEDATATRDRHRDYYARFLEGRRDGVFGARQGVVLAEIAPEFKNIRQAWGHAVAQRHVADIRRVTPTLNQFCDVRGRYQEGVEMLQAASDALATVEGEEAALTRALLLTLLGFMRIRLGALDRSELDVEEASRLLDDFTADPLPGFATDPALAQALLANVRGEYERVPALVAEAEALHTARGDVFNLQILYYVLTDAAFARGRYEAAKAYAEKAYMLTEQTEHEWMMAYVVTQQGSIARARGDYEAAQAHFETAYAIKKALDDPEGVAMTANHLAHIAWLQGEYGRAEENYRQSASIYRDIGDRGGLATTLAGLADTALAQDDREKARAYFREALAIAADIPYTPLVLAILVGVADLLARAGKEAEAVTLLTLVREHGGGGEEVRVRADRLLARYQTTITPEARAAVLQEGKELLLAEAVIMVQRLLAGGGA